MNIDKAPISITLPNNILKPFIRTNLPKEDEKVFIKEFGKSMTLINKISMQLSCLDKGKQVRCLDKNAKD